MMFKQKMILSFKKARMDFESLKANMHQWIHHLHGRQTDVEVRLRELEMKVRDLEKQRIQVY